MIRPWIIGLLPIACASMALAQDALDQQQPVVRAANVPTTLPGSAWLDLRQNASANSVQAAPDWVESVTLIPQEAQGDTAASTIFRIRVKNPSTNYNVLYFRLFFQDNANAEPRLVAWDESGSQVLPSGSLGEGTGLPTSVSTVVPMIGVT
ncbi:MAG: hypothetical protein M3R59_08235, partial [Verrucomicrobiota bacterium]|nr:hypothetical protein [Verrucomicrobiota bacterium]